MSPYVAHLIAFVVSVFAFAAIVITGHGNDHLVTSLVGGVMGGSGSYSIAGVVNSFLNSANSTPASPQGPKNQGGFVRLALLLFLAALSLAACASLKAPNFGSPTSQLQNVETLCASASGALDSLSVVEQVHPLPADAIKTVSTAVAALAPVCTAPHPQTYTDVEVSAAQSAVNALTALSIQNSAH